MGLFDKKDHIKSSKDLKLELKRKASELHLTEKQRREVADKAKSYLRDASGMSKKEWWKVTKDFREKRDDSIDRTQAERLKRFGK